MSNLNLHGAASRYLFRAALIGGITMLAGCGSPPPQSVSTTTEQTTSAPAGTTLSPAGNIEPGTPGSTTTTTTNTQTQPSQ